MKRLLSVLTLIAVIAIANCRADGFSTTPMPLVESSSDVVLHFDAKKGGNASIAAMGEDDALYAHIGVYTTKSPATWAHVKTSWPTSSTDAKANTETNKFKYVGNGCWDLTLGDLRTYFGITDEAETITTICVIARDAKGSKQTADNFIQLSEDVFAIDIKHDAPSIMTAAGAVNITLGSTRDADLTIKLDGTVLSQGKGLSLTAVANISDKGSHLVEGVATANGQTLTKSTYIVYASDPVAADYPGGKPRMGAVRNSDGTVTFCLGAPGKQTVYLFGSWSDFNADGASVMNYQDYNGNRYFWTTVSGLDDSTDYLYYYQVDGTTNVADPYAHLVLDPYNDRYISTKVFPDMPAYPAQLGNTMLAVYRGNLDDYDWQVKDFEIPDHYSLNIYELLLRDFTGTSRVADGTVRAAIARIPYLKALGINVVELLPIMEFNGNNSWGYNTNFYMAPDKAYGTPDDYKEFIDECHANGIAVVLDIVFNQSDGLHPWYQMYPIASNPFYNATAPHKWSVLNDWNQGHDMVQQQWEDAIRYWLEVYNVDGFRFDLVKGLALNEHYTTGGANTDSYIAGRVQVMKRINEYITKVKPDAIHINELLGDAKEDNENYLNGGQMGWMQANNNACQYAMGYANQSILTAFTETKWGRSKGATVSYAESHDEQRMAFKQTKWGVDAIKNDLSVRTKRLGSVAAQMLMAPGSHMIWMFGELGANENTKDAKFENNDTSPKPLYWSRATSPDYIGLHDNYANLLNLRLNNPELFSRDVDAVYYGFMDNSFGGRSIRLTADKSEAVLLVNPSLTAPATVSVPTNLLNASNAKLATATEGFVDGAFSFEDGKFSATIPANSFAVYVTNNVNGIESVAGDDTGVKVYVSDRRICADGDYNTMDVYDMSGRMVDNDNLAKGVYVVSIDGNATKVVVR